MSQSIVFSHQKQERIKLYAILYNSSKLKELIRHQEEKISKSELEILTANGNWGNFLKEDIRESKENIEILKAAIKIRENNNQALKN